MNLFNDLLGTILTDKTLKSKSQKDKTLISSNDDENENENENENDKTLMLSNDDDDDDDDDGDGDDDEAMSQNEKNIRIKNINDRLDQIIDKSKSFEDQIKLLKKIENLNEYYFNKDFGDKELKFKYFKLKLAYLSNIIYKKLFKQIFGHTLEKLANKLINRTNKEENQTIVNNINKNKEKLHEEDDKEKLHQAINVLIYLTLLILFWTLIKQFN